MGRVKVEMKKIENKTYRHITFAKRKSGLVKKAYEISTLCDVEVALIVFSPAGKLILFDGKRRVEEIIKHYIDLPPHQRGRLPDQEAVRRLVTQMRTESELCQQIRSSNNGNLDNRVNVENYLERIQAELSSRNLELEEVEKELDKYFINTPNSIRSLNEAEFLEMLLEDAINKVSLQQNKLDEEEVFKQLPSQVMQPQTESSGSEFLMGSPTCSLGWLDHSPNYATNFGTPLTGVQPPVANPSASQQQFADSSARFQQQFAHSSAGFLQQFADSLAGFRQQFANSSAGFQQQPPNSVENQPQFANSTGYQPQFANPTGIQTQLANPGRFQTQFANPGGFQAQFANSGVGVQTQFASGTGFQPQLANSGAGFQPQLANSGSRFQPQLANSGAGFQPQFTNSAGFQPHFASATGYQPFATGFHPFSLGFQLPRTPSADPFAEMSPISSVAFGSAGFPAGNAMSNGNSDPFDHGLFSQPVEHNGIFNAQFSPGMNNLQLGGASTSSARPSQVPGDAATGTGSTHGNGSASSPSFDFSDLPSPF